MPHLHSNWRPRANLSPSFATAHFRTHHETPDPFDIVFLSVCAHARQGAAASDDEAKIGRVIESFHAAVESRDKPRYLNLFLQGNVSWQSVMEDFS
jgi:hypothetical protein